MLTRHTGRCHLGNPAWLYLSSVLGEDQVALWLDPDAPLIPGRVNVAPVSLIGDRSPQCDLFVSTWALSESTRASQDFVADRDWFGADHLLLAYSQGDRIFSDSGHLGELARDAGAVEESIDILDPFPTDHFYAFR
jgi:hypothetical protein